MRFPTRLLALPWLAATLLGTPPVGAQTVTDPALTLETPLTGLSFPTTMAFVGPDEFLVLQRLNGIVFHVAGGTIQGTALDVSVSTVSERGLLGIAVNPNDATDVFLYYTEAASDGGVALGNRVYRYVWDAGTGTLHSPTLVRDLPVLPGANHDGGILIHDGTHLFAVIGDLNRNGQLQNFPAGPAPDDSGVILRMLPDGSPAPGNPFTPYCSATTSTTCTDDGDCPGGETCIDEVARYWAYGVRNSFGMALDPATGLLWDTENGPSLWDEVNLVEAGFNSGWEQIMGPEGLDPEDPNDLFDVPGAGSTYSNPEFSWLDTNAPTSIVFPVGSGLGPAYDDVALIGDANAGQIYRFPLDPARDRFDFSAFPDLVDTVANDNAERDQLAWGSGFGAVTDLEIGPDGALWVVSTTNGAVYRISGPGRPVPAMGPVAWSLFAGALLGCAAVAARARRRASA